MAVTLRQVMDCTRCIVGGAVIGGGLGYLSYLPSLLVEGSEAYSRSGGNIALGVTLVCARAGAVIGLIYYLVRRSLLADPVAR